MRTRKDTARTGPLQVQALYSVRALAQAANVTPHLMRRVLRAAHVETLRAQRAIFVPLTELEAKLPQLWASIQAAERLRFGCDEGEV
jgi:hypothetical protein